MRKWTQYEFWPTWLFYAPFVPYWIMRSIQSGSFSYFCKVNPGIKFGGFLDYSKYDIIEQIPDNFKPKTHLLQKKSEPLPFEFPFVAKPNLGERGVNVEFIQNQQQWDQYPVQDEIILQEIIDYPYEFGVFYAKNPKTDSGEILSITGKEFLQFTSDGQNTIRNFVEYHPRAQSRKEYLQQKFKDQLDHIYPKSTKILLEPIGNHNRGTKFYNASDLISEQLTQHISYIAKGINGFNYGRFDIKTISIEAFKNGEFKVLEINGANSEATHIYDPKYTLPQAYKEVKRHLDRQFKLAKSNPKTHSSQSFYLSILRRILS